MPRPPSTVILNPQALRVLREKDGHTLKSLAAACEPPLTKGYLCDLEQGRRLGNAPLIKRLAKALNVPVSVLEKRREPVAQDDVA